MSYRRKGFTLIELLVVIAIIAILAALLFPVFIVAKERSRMSHCIGNFHQIGKGLTMYHDDYGYYPPFLASLYRSYLSNNKNVFICRSDPKKGMLPRELCPPDWEHQHGFNVLWKTGTDPKGRSTVGCSYAYIPRAAFWYSSGGRKGMWRGDNSWANTPEDRGDPTKWEPLFDSFTPIIFDWRHAQDEDTPTTVIRPLYKKKASVLVLILGGSVLRCDHERLLPCWEQLKFRGNEYATHPRQVLH